MMRRRAVLKGAGVATVLVAAGVVGRAYDQGVLGTARDPAGEPWTTWRGDAGEGPVALARAAILAANPHNIQPRRFRVAPARVDLFEDRERSIGTIDPYRREVHIGLGCALENLVLAAGAGGYFHRLAVAPDPANPSHVARVDLVPAPPTASALYAAIPARHTNRGPYERRAVTREILDGLTALGVDHPDMAVA